MARISRKASSVGMALVQSILSLNYAYLSISAYTSDSSDGFIYSPKNHFYFCCFHILKNLGVVILAVDAHSQVMGVLNMWRSLARRLSYPSSKSKSSFRPIGTPSIYTFTNNVRRRRADAVRVLLRNGLIGGQSGSTWFLPITHPC